MRQHECDKYATDLIRIINIMTSVPIPFQLSRKCERNRDHEIVTWRDRIVIGFDLQNHLGIPIYKVQQRKGYERCIKLHIGRLLLIKTKRIS